MKMLVNNCYTIVTVSVRRDLVIASGLDGANNNLKTSQIDFAPVHSLLKDNLYYRASYQFNGDDTEAADRMISRALDIKGYKYIYK